MRVLVVDQDSEMLEAVARAFEVDVATSKAACIDLLRANEYELVIACERLGDGSGLELLSQIAKRWPAVLRVLAVERSRGAQLRGKLLGPFKLFATLPYPIIEEKLEAVLDRAHAELVSEDARGGGNASMDAETVKVQRVLAPTVPARSPSPTRPVRPPSAKPAAAPLPSPSTPAPHMRYKPPSPRRSSSTKFVPLGTADEPGYRILPHDSFRSEEPVASRAARMPATPAPRRASFHQRAAALAVEAVTALSAVVGRYMRPSAGKSASGTQPAHRPGSSRQDPGRSASNRPDPGRSAANRPGSNRPAAANRSSNNKPPSPDPRTPRKR